MDFEISPKQIGEAKRKHILAHFGVEDNVEKALSKDQFNEKYGVGHDVFTLSQLAEFETAVKTQHGNTDDVSKAIKAEFDTFSKVLVKGTENGMEEVFVREQSSEEVSKSVDSNEDPEEGEESEEAEEGAEENTEESAE